MFDIKDYEERMKKSISVYEEDLASVRVGRATPGALSKITIDYYGTPTPIAQIGDVKTPDARTLVITPWDSSLLKAVEKAINTSDLGINPQNDGRCIRLVFPQLTEERRKELAKQITKKGEDAKVAIRNIRRDANDKTKELKKKSELTEDDVKNYDKKIQDMTDKYIKEIETVTDKKEKEIMAI